MDSDLCKWALSGMGTAVCAMAFAFWKVLSWWKKETEGRLKDSRDLSKMLGGDDETKHS